jgi:phage replication initiation protein
MSKQGQPPYGNTGAQNTNENGLKVLVDWVSVTFKNLEKHFLIEVLGLEYEKFKKLHIGAMGYSMSLRFENICIYYAGSTPEMGIHLVMTGTGCRQYEAETDNYDWSIFFAKVLDVGGKFTRLDLAIDDYKGYFNLKQIERKVKAGHVTSRFKDVTNYEKIRVKDGYVKGQTLYFGSTTSRVLIRFYDKLKERLGKGKELPEGVTFWNRTELQLSKSRAQVAATFIAYEEKQAGEIAMGILKEYVRFLKKGTDSNKSRWETWGNWEKFLQDVEPLRIVEQPKQKTIDDKVNWIDKQVSKSLYVVAQAKSWGFLAGMIESAATKLSSDDVLMIERYKEEKNKKAPLTGNKRKPTHKNEHVIELEPF